MWFKSYNLRRINAHAAMGNPRPVPVLLPLTKCSLINLNTIIVWVHVYMLITLRQWFYLYRVTSQHFFYKVNDKSRTETRSEWDPQRHSRSELSAILDFLSNILASFPGLYEDRLGYDFGWAFHKSDPPIVSTLVYYRLHRPSLLLSHLKYIEVSFNHRIR